MESRGMKRGARTKKALSTLFALALVMGLWPAASALAATGAGPADGPGAVAAADEPLAVDNGADQGDPDSEGALDEEGGPGADEPDAGEGLAVADVTLLAAADASSIDITDADSLKSAFATANATQGEYTFNIQADITAAAGSTNALSSGSTVTILGNGHTIDLSQSGALVSITNGTLNLETEKSAATGSVITLSGSPGTVINLQNSNTRAAKLKMYGGVIKDNGGTGDAASGGIWCLGGGVEIHGGTFENNSGSGGGAIALYYGSVAIWDGAVFKNNTCTGAEGGGAIGSHINTSGITVRGGTFTGNKATYRGGAISAYNGGGIFLNGGTFTGNEASGYDTSDYPGGGGAIASCMGQIALAGNVTFSNNKAPNGWGGAILSLGGDLKLDSRNELIAARLGGSPGKATITGNSAKIGGGIASGTFSDATTTYLAPVTMYAGNLHNNTASQQAADVFANHKSVTLVSAADMEATLASTSMPITGWFSDDSTRWTKDEPTADLSSSYNASAPISLIAAHGKTAKSVSYQYTGDVPTGAPAVPTSSDVETGEEVTVADAPTMTGYTFSGWTATGVTVTDGKFTMPDTDVTFTGSWKINQYTITFDTDGGSPVGPITQDYGSAVTPPTNPTKDGYAFAGWEPTLPTTMPAENTTVKAKWTPVEYAISYDLDGGTVDGTNPESFTIESDDITLINPTKAGHAFAGWTGTGLDAATTTVTIPKGSTGERSYTATWTPNRHAVAFDTQGGSPIGAATVDYGSAVAAPVDPTRDGYTFKGWTLDGKPYDFSAPVTGDITLKATWEAVPAPDPAPAPAPEPSDGGEAAPAGGDAAGPAAGSTATTVTTVASTRTAGEPAKGAKDAAPAGKSATPKTGDMPAGGMLALALMAAAAGGTLGIAGWRRRRGAEGAPAAGEER